MLSEWRTGAKAWDPVTVPMKVPGEVVFQIKASLFRKVRCVNHPVDNQQIVA